jgi:hypothetical protein
MSRRTRAWVLVLAGSLLSAAGAAAPAEDTPKWDQVANIKDAAERLGNLHRTRGAKGAYDFIDACYRTHSLAEEYGQAFESCIAQDYLETKVLASVYSRLPPEFLARNRVPSPEALADAMGRRIVAAFAQYNKPVAYAEDFKKLVDQHGFPIFLAILFPAKPQNDSGDGREHKQ